MSEAIEFKGNHMGKSNLLSALVTGQNFTLFCFDGLLAFSFTLRK